MHLGFEDHQMKRGADVNVIIILFKVDWSTNICGQVYHMPLKRDNRLRCQKMQVLYFRKASEIGRTFSGPGFRCSSREVNFPISCLNQKGMHWEGSTARPGLEGTRWSQGWRGGLSNC